MTILSRATFLLLTFVLLSTATLFAAPITGNGPGGVGDPTVAGDLRLWLRSDVGVQSTGGFVDQWDDQSAYNSHFIQTTSARRPVYSGVQNGLPILSFSNASAQFLNAPVAGFPIGGTPGAGVTSYAAYNQNPGANAAFDQNGLPFFARSTSFFGFHSNDGGLATFSISAYTVPGGAVGTTVNGTFGGLMTEGSWGSVQGTHAGTAPTPATGLNSITFTDLTVGWDVGGRYLDGQIGEVVFYNTTLNAPQQRLVQNYMSSKYDTPLAGIDHYDGDTGGNGNYDYGVFGVLNIGNVSVTNSGMDGFGIEATPGLNQGALAGHKVLSNSILNGVNIGPHLYASIWERSWYVDSDETFGGTIGFNSIDAGLGALDGSQDYFVLFRDTEVGDWSVLGEGTVSGDLVSLNLDNLLSGYYTLAFNVTYLPEPSSLTIFAIGAICLASRSRRRRNAKNGTESVRR